MIEYPNSQYDTPEQFGRNPADAVKRWQLEIDIYTENTRKWRESCRDVWHRYRAQKLKRNSFNILWSNTEVLRPALYNSLPQPDVRQRFKDADQVGRAVAEVISRCLAFAADDPQFDLSIKSAILDMLLPSRGICRIRYVPSISQTGIEDTQQEIATSDEMIESDSYEELKWEQVCVEHVQWDDFAHGPGNDWSEVMWIGFRHRLTRDELEEKFGEDIAAQVKMTDVNPIVKSRITSEDPIKELFKTADVWEIWDKDERNVIFISDGYKDAPLAVMDDPLELDQFFPVPKPLYCIEDSGSLIPIVLYEQYREQADELDRLNWRMNRIIDAVRVRGAYDATLKEMSQIMTSEDNNLIPISNVAAIYERGGIASSIWMLPIDALAAVLRELSAKAEQCKSVIYELTGIADIMRGASNPNETATAQGIKAQWGSGRLSKMQLEVARFIRDLMRLAAEIIAKKFQPETLISMTNLPIPTLQQAQLHVMQQYQQAITQSAGQYQQAVAQAVQHGQEPPPQPPPPAAEPLPLNWDQVIQLMHDDALRSYRIDVETDSTIAASQQADMSQLKDLVLSVNQTLAQLMPLVQATVLPVDAVKEVVMAIIRRAKLGNAVEDAFDKLQQPPPPPPPPAPIQPGAGPGIPPAQQLQLEMQKIAAKAQADQQKVQLQAQAAQANQQARLQADIAIATMEARVEQEIAQLKAQLEAQIELVKHGMSLQQQPSQSTPPLMYPGIQNAAV